MDEQLHQHYLFFKRHLDAEFGLRELWDIALELRMNPEHWPHQTLSEMADGLLRMIDRGRHHQELVTILRRERPSIPWPETYHYPTSVVRAELIFDSLSLRSHQVDLKTNLVILQEWKSIHYNVQRLLLSIHRWERTLRVCEEAWHHYSMRRTNKTRRDVESTINSVDDNWRAHCHRKLVELRDELSKLSLIKHKLINSLLSVLVEEHELHINSCVYKLRPDTDHSIRLLRASFTELDGLLVETLTAADLNIIHFADALNEQLNIN